MNFIRRQWFVMAFLATLTTSTLRDGDIIFHRSTSRQAVAIAAATHSDYTHVGLVFFDHGKPFVYEAVQPVKRTPLKEWITRGERQQFVVKQLKADRQLNSAALKYEVQSMLARISHPKRAGVGTKIVLGLELSSNNPCHAPHSNSNSL